MRLSAAGLQQYSAKLLLLVLAGVNEAQVSSVAKNSPAVG
jgi:hypothetical protein